MGRRKKLAEIDRLEGNPGRRFIEETGIEALGSPFIPEHLSDDARGCIEVIKQSMPGKRTASFSRRWHGRGPSIKSQG